MRTCIASEPAVGPISCAQLPLTTLKNQFGEDNANLENNLHIGNEQTVRSSF